MTLFARSDVAGVSVSVDLGGCGQFHGRPVVNGKPARLFAIACPGCESALRADPCWTPHRWEIPLTPDEEREAEALEKQAELLLQRERAEQARELSRRVAAEHNNSDDEPLVLVGPGQPATQGTPERSTTPEPRTPPPPPSVTSEDLAKADETMPLSKLTVLQLRIRCREAGLGQAGSKKDLIDRLKTAGA